MAQSFYESVDPRCFECPTGSLCAATANDTEIFCIVRYKLNEIPIGNSCTLPLIVISMIVGFLLLMNILSVFLLIRRRRIQVYDLPTTMDERSAVYRAEADLIRKIGQWKASQDESLIDETSGADATEKPGKPNEDLMNSDDTTCEEINGVQVEDCAADGKSEENWAKKVVENREIEE